MQMCRTLTMPEVDVSLAARHYQHHRALSKMHQIITGHLHWNRHKELDGVTMAVERQLSVRHATPRNEFGRRES